MTIRGERGNVPEKGFAAEIQILVSAGFGLVPGRICLGLSQYVECYRGLWDYFAVETLHGNFAFI